MIPERLKNDIGAWLEFSRELGFDEFLIEKRPPVAPSASVTADVSLTTNASVASPAEGAEETETLMPRAHTFNSPIEATRPTSTARPPATARSLSLFESEAPRAKERETLAEIRTDLGDCHRCKLADGRRNIVFGQGNEHAELVIVGEGPGADEDEQGLPFVGRAGKLLNRMLQEVGIRREDVYICNVVKCRPPGNRAPERDEVEACSPFLYRQIEAIRPRLVCCLGAPAAKTVLGLKEGMLKIRGQFYDFGAAKAMPTVHPAYVLRNPREEKLLREDFEKIRAFLKTPAAR